MKKNKKIYNEVVQLTETSKGLKIEEIFAVHNTTVYVLDKLVSAIDRWGDLWKRASAWTFFVHDMDFIQQEKEDMQSGQHHVVRNKWGQDAQMGRTEDSLRGYARKWWSQWKKAPQNKGKLSYSHRPEKEDLFWRAFNSAPEAVQNALVLAVNERAGQLYSGVLRRFESVEDFRARAVISLNGESSCAWGILTASDWKGRRYSEDYQYVDKELAKIVKKHVRFEAVNYVEDGQVAV